MRKRYKPYGSRTRSPTQTGYPRQSGIEAEADPATLVRSYAIGLFERREGHAADWPLIAQALFQAAFAAVDEDKLDKCVLSVLRRAHADAYDRIVGNTADSPPLTGLS